MHNGAQRITLVAFTLLTLIGLFFSYYNRSQAASGKYRIGLLYFPTITHHVRIIDKIKKLVADDKRFESIDFSCGSVDLMVVNAVCETALCSNADIFITVGTNCSRTMIQTSRRRKIATPIVFLGVADPADLGLINSIKNPGSNATGLYALMASDEVDFIALAKLIKPSLRNLLIPYSSHEKASEEAVNNMKKLGISNGVTVTGLKIDVISETLDRLSGILSEYDMLMYIEIDPVAWYSIGMGKLASQYGVTMFARSLDGIADAVLSYTADSVYYAQPAFNLVKSILINHQSPSTIPAELMGEGYNLIINTALCAQQGLKNIDIARIMTTIKADSQFSMLRDHVMVQ